MWLRWKNLIPFPNSNINLRVVYTCENDLDSPCFISFGIFMGILPLLHTCKCQKVDLSLQDGNCLFAGILQVERAKSSLNHLIEDAFRCLTVERERALLVLSAIWRNSRISLALSTYYNTSSKGSLR